MRYYTQKKLRQLGEEQGVKYRSKMSCETLARKLDVPYERCVYFDTYIRDKIKKPIGIIAVDPTTGESLGEFPSIYSAKNHFKVSYKKFYEYIKTQKVVSAFGCDVILVREY